MQSGHRVAVCILDENESVPFDRRVWLEARALTEAGYQVSVVCPVGTTDKRWRETICGVEIYRYPSFKATRTLGYLIEYAWSLLVQFLLTLYVYAKRRFRILHGCSPPDIIFLIGLFFKAFGVRYVFDHHDLSPELYALRFGPRGFFYRLVCLAERLSFTAADVSIATNETFMEIARDRGGVSPDRIAIVRTCAPLHSSSPEPGPLDLKNGYPFLVVYVGQMEPQDGVDLLLESIRYIVEKRKRTDVLFVLIGSGSELERLCEQVGTWTNTAQVKFTGRVPHSEVCRYLAAADICVAPDPPNPFNDTCSMVKIFEYMAYAKPIVLFDLKEGRRSTAGAALYAMPNDAKDFAEQILKLLNCESLRKELGVKGRLRVEEVLNWETQRQELIRAYDMLSGIVRPSNSDSPAKSHASADIFPADASGAEGQS
jgi:glycosyltransferase involved in cell wall biosynthesis